MAATKLRSFFRAFYRNKRLLAPAAISAFALLSVIYVNAHLNADLPNRLQDFITLSLSVFVEAFPFLILGSVLAVLVRTFIPSALFRRVLPKQGVPRRAVISLLGFLFPVCECGNVPLARTLLREKLSVADSVTFLLAAPVINPVTLWATSEAFGFDPKIVVTRFIATFLIANLIGFIISLRKDQKSYLTTSFQNETHAHEVNAKASFPDKARAVPALFQAETLLMIKMLASGAIIAGLVQTVIPRSLLVDIGSNVVLSIVAMILLAFVISICANVDSFFALAFSNTFTAGSIVAFLVFGPMVDIKMLALMRTTFKTELLVIISVMVTLLSIITGLMFTYVL